MTKEVQAARTRVCKAPRSCCPWLWKEGRGSWSGGSSHVVLKEPPAGNKGPCEGWPLPACAHCPAPRSERRTWGPESSLPSGCGRVVQGRVVSSAGSWGCGE